MFSIVLGTTNRKKGLEWAELLTPHRVFVRTLADFEQKLEVTEDRETFLENARKKASEQALFLNTWVIGEDSGLSVDALNGEPGIHSARFASALKEQNVSDETNNQLLLKKLGKTPLEKRTAHYTCAAAIADPQGNIRGESEQYCNGRILSKPVGNGGFGYDPLFEIIEYHQTFGNMASAVKQAISHRARTMRQLITILLRLINKKE
jgi:XTP/dITP diphosphohydrolase